MANLVLVTGAGGFIGGHLVRYLHAQGVPVRALVHSKRDLEPLKSLGIDTCVGDLTKPESLFPALEGVHAVHNIAGLFRQAGIPESEFFKVNAEGTRQLFEAALVTGVKRIVHCSTVGVLSDVGCSAVDETAPYNPGDPYQHSKMEGEIAALDYFASGRIQGVVIRPAMVYGPGDMRTLKLFKMIAKQRFFYVGSGACSVHFVDVRDLVRAFDRAMQRSELNAEVYIVAGRNAYPLNQLVKKIAAELGVAEPWLHLPIKPMQLLGTICEAVCTPLGINPPIFRRRVDFYTKSRSFLIDKARAHLDFEPSGSVEDEIRAIIKWYVLNGFISSSVTPGLVASPSMLRRMEGRITSWADDSEALYGYSKSDAVGAVSHHLLRTEFPEPLVSINFKLRSAQRWEGMLTHTKRDGSRIKVLSRWEITPDVQRGALQVLETNKPHVEEEQSRASGMLSWCIGLANLFEGNAAASLGLVL